MADQQPQYPQAFTEGATASKPESVAAGTAPAPGSQVPFPNLVPEGAFSPSTEKQVSDLLAEMQQYTSSATPGTTTTVQYSYQKSKHTREATGEEPQAYESKQVEKAVQQTPPPEQKPQQEQTQQQQPQPQPEQRKPPPEASHGTSIFSHIPQFLQEKLGFGGGSTTQQEGEQQTQVSYHHTKKTTTTTTTTAGGDPTTVTRTETPPPAQGTQHQQQTTMAPQQASEGESLISISPIEIVKRDGNTKIEYSKHASRQVFTQSGEQPPHIETTSTGYVQVIHGIFDGVPVSGGVIPTIVRVSVQNPGTEAEAPLLQQSQTGPSPPQPEAAARPTPPPGLGTGAGTPTGASGYSTATIDATAQLEEQLKKLGLTADHPVSELLQKTLSQHQRAQTPESNIEIQYSAQRTHSSRTVTYEAPGADSKAAQEALQQLQNTLSTVAPPSQAVPEAPANSSQSEYVEGSHIDEDGNLVITRKTTRVTTTMRTAYDDGSQPGAGSQPPTYQPGTTGNQPPPTQGLFLSQPLIRLKINRDVFNGILDQDQHIQLVPVSK